MKADDIERAIIAAKQAGKAILKLFNSDIAISEKKDGSPLTEADKISDQVISLLLAESGLPVVSEEGSALQTASEIYWLVDPLDGTKEFINGIGEFTVNIALIIDELPAFGVIYSPVDNVLYCGGRRLGCWKELHAEKHYCEYKGLHSSPRMVVSRFHDHPDLDLFAGQNSIKNIIKVGSSLKFVYLAFGQADVYPRLVGSSEWDTAAGQAILEGAGGAVLEWNRDWSLKYGKPRRRNPRFIALRKPLKRNDFKMSYYQEELL